MEVAYVFIYYWGCRMLFDLCIVPDHFNGNLGWHWIFPKGKGVLRRKRREGKKKRLQYP